jgi:hypothetical protein
MFIPLALIIVYCFIARISGDIRTKTSRDLDQKVKNLDENTKRRVLAMDAAGVPHESIAQTIKYQAGQSVAAASRLVYGIKMEADQKKRR